jgi:group I intron endonuclease
MIGIYKITNKVNNKVYIGVSLDIEKRWKQHKINYLNSSNKEYNKYLYQDFRKYGIENFVFEILEELPKSEIYEREKYWIKYFDSSVSGYNETLGGECGSLKGHCSGEKNGRARLTKEDVILIRQDYNNHIKKKDSYEKFKDKISFGGFSKVWTGITWKDIMPEVFSKENKEWHSTFGKTNCGENNGCSLLNKNQILEIRIAKKNGKDKKEVFQDYSDLIAYSTFEQIWYEMTYKEDVL